MVKETFHNTGGDKRLRGRISGDLLIERGKEAGKH